MLRDGGNFFYDGTKSRLGSVRDECHRLHRDLCDSKLLGFQGRAHTRKHTHMHTHAHTQKNVSCKATFILSCAHDAGSRKQAAVS